MPPTQPTLLTARLILHPFTLADAPTVQHLAGELEVAAMTLPIPHVQPSLHKPQATAVFVLVD